MRAPLPMSVRGPWGSWEEVVKKRAVDKFHTKMTHCPKCLEVMSLQKYARHKAGQGDPKCPGEYVSKYRKGETK